MSLHNRTSLYLFFGCRWALLLLAAVLFQTIYSLLQLYKMCRIVAIMAAIADICFGIYLLGLTGGFSSPFLIYSFTGLLMVKSFVSWRQYYPILLVYVAGIPILFAMTSGVLIYRYVLAHFDYGFIVFAYFCLVSLVHYY